MLTILTENYGKLTESYGKFTKIKFWYFDVFYDPEHGMRFKLIFYIMPVSVFFKNHCNTTLKKWISHFINQKKII